MVEYRVESAGAWEALCTEQFQLCSVEWAAPGFEASIRTTREALPALSLQRVTSGPFGVSRTPAQARHDSDDLMVVFQDAGEEGRVEHRGQQGLLVPGDAVLIDTRMPYRFDFGAPVQQTVVKVARAQFETLEAEAGRVIKTRGTPLGTVVRAALNELIYLEDHAGWRRETAAALSAAAIDLMAGLCAADRSTTRTLGHEALLRSAQEFIRSRLADPGLNIGLVAGHLRVSPRLLAKVFAEGGVSPAAFIRKVRMEQAARLLASTAHRGTAVFDIGVRVGIPDATTFARAFRRVHGMVPSEYRALVVERGKPAR